MIPDPTEEIKAIRHKLAAEFGFDVRRIGADIRRQQVESGRTYITLPKCEPTRARAAGNIPMHPSREVGLIDVENHSSPPRDR